MPSPRNDLRSRARTVAATGTEFMRRLGGGCGRRGSGSGAARVLLLCALTTVTGISLHAQERAPAGTEFTGYYTVAVTLEHLDGTAFRTPRGVYYDPWFDEIFVADSGNGLIAIFDRQGVPKFSFSPGRSQESPVAVTTDPEGEIYVLNAGATRIVVFDYRGRPAREIPLDPVDREPIQASGMARGPDGNLYVLDTGGRRILVLSLQGEMIRIIGGGSGPRLRVPYDLAFDAEGNLYVSDRRGTPIQVYDPRGKYLRGWGKRDLGAENFSIPSGIAVDGSGRVLIADSSRQDVKVFDGRGRFLGNFGGFGSELGQMAYPADVAATPDGRILVLERVGRRLQIMERIPAKSEKNLAISPDTPSVGEDPAP